MRKLILKVFVVLVCIGVVGTTLSGCSKEELFPLVTKNPQELTLEDLTVHINGVNISLFRNVEDTIQASKNKLVYDPNNAETIGDKIKHVAIYMSNEEVVRNMTIIQGKNFTKNEIKKEEAKIGSITVNDYGFTKQQVVLPNQLTYGDTQAEVIKKCGQPMRVDFKDNMEIYYYHDVVKMNRVYASITFEDKKLVSFRYGTFAKEMPTEDIKSLRTEKVSGIKPILDVSKIEEGPNKDILNTKTVTMGTTELKKGITFQQFVEDGWKVKRTLKTGYQVVDVQMQRGKDKCVLTMEENYTNESAIKDVLVTEPFNVDLIPTFPGDVDALEWNAVLSNYGKPSYLHMSKGLFVSYIVDDVQMSVAYDSQLQLDYYSIRFNARE